MTAIFDWMVAFALARQQGMTDEQIAERRNYRQSKLLTPREKAAVWFADVLAGDHTQTSNALYNELRRYFTESEIVDLGSESPPLWAMGD